ncbi:omega-amidase NIT2-like [Phlebotomus argentipes]|uniref:omega-amidase NIT2-like n=1 Tax=Phlebotomus argentipes TaxID=94469 RepID=UPI00289375C3|nr:omega-amidase NIT2-like [Phlebotomus argentipes]
MSDSGDSSEHLQPEAPLESIFTVRVILLQLKPKKSKRETVDHCCAKIREAVKKYGPGSETWTIRNRTIVCILPEYFNCQYDFSRLAANAEQIPDGNTSNQISNLAAELNINIIAGAMPEYGHSSHPPIFSTCAIYSTEGEIIGKYRKLHLFDVDVAGCYPYKESDIFTQGRDYITTHIDNMMIGVGIGYDIRFDELARVYRKEGCNFLVYPASFPTTHGPRDWDVLQRARAMDTQCYVATVAQARDDKHHFLSYGHSSLVDPFGKVVACAGVDEAIIASDLDTNLVERARLQIPISLHRRTDVYDTIIY